MKFYVKLKVNGNDMYVMRLGAIWNETVLVSHKAEAREFVANTENDLIRITDYIVNKNMTIVPVAAQLPRPAFIALLDEADRHTEQRWNRRLLEIFGTQKAVDTMMRVVHGNARRNMPQFLAGDVVQDYRLLLSSQISDILAKGAPIALKKAQARFRQNLQLAYDAAFRKSTWQ